MAEAPVVVWPRRVSRRVIRQLYELDAKGIVDAELINEVGFGLLARCESIVIVTSAHHRGQVTCPACGGDVVRLRPLHVRTQPLHCDSCGWTTTWGAYYDSYRRHGDGRLTGGSALPAYHEFITRFRTARTPRARLLAIDSLIHRFHHELKVSTMPAAASLIEGSTSDIIDFLDQLSAGDGSTRTWRASALGRAGLGIRLRALRVAMDLTQHQAGALIGVTNTRICALETGRLGVSPPLVERLALALSASRKEAADLAATAERLGARTRPSRDQRLGVDCFLTESQPRKGDNRRRAHRGEGQVGVERQGGRSPPRDASSRDRSPAASSPAACSPPPAIRPSLPSAPSTPSTAACRDTEPVRLHLERLLASGMEISRVAALGGMTPVGIELLLSGRLPHMSGYMARKLLAIEAH
jgi:transcriptional regulator with XRE-family HTH domain/predicted RNA-binding Zn-ribbon protein involved in translation (DUF1610 family)